MAHYAVGAAGLASFGLRGRKLALYSLWGAAADVDFLPAIAWTLGAPQTGLGADALRTGARVFGHRGFSHTIVAALLAGLLVWALTRDREHGLAAGFAWTLHVVLDTLTEWTTIPFWPLTDASYRIPLVTTMDPIMTIASIVTIVALLGPSAFAKLGWPDASAREKLRDWGYRSGHRWAYLTLAAVAFSAAMVGWAGLASEDEVALAAHAPRTVTLDRPIAAEADAWTATARWLPALDGEPRSLSYATNATQAPDGTLATAECTLDAVGPFAPIDRPIWELRPSGDGEARWIASAHDLVRNATGDDGPVVHIAIVDGQVQQAWIGEAGEDEPGFRPTLPDQLWEESACP